MSEEFPGENREVSDLTEHRREREKTISKRRAASMRRHTSVANQDTDVTNMGDRRPADRSDIERLIDRGELSKTTFIIELPDVEDEE